MSPRRGPHKRIGAEPVVVRIEPPPAQSVKSRSRKWWAGVLAPVVTGVLLLPATSVWNALTGGHAPAEPSGPPLLIRMAVQQRTVGQGRTYVFAGTDVTADQLNTLNLNDGTAFQQWMAGHHGVDPRIASVKLVLEGNRNHTVRITNIVIRPTCQAALTGTLLYDPPQGSGQDPTVRLIYDLDRNQTIPNFQRGDEDSVHQDYFGNYTAFLDKGAQMTFDVLAATAKSYCTFTIDITVLDAGSTVHETAGDQTRPFAVSAVLAQSSPPHPLYSAYQSVIVEGYVAGQPTVNWAQVDPKTFNRG